MRGLLDTHTFLWFIAAHPALSAPARKWIETSANERLLSVASLWEIAIKASAGKLTVPLPMTELVATHIVGNAIKLLPIAPPHLDRLVTLPFHHRDPFDRLIIAQAKSEALPIVGRDAQFDAYSITRIW